MARKRNTTPTPAAEEAAIVAQAILPTREPGEKAPFRGAGFADFRAKHNARWNEKAQRMVHDNEDDIAEQLAFEISEFGWWNAPLVLQHLGPRLPELQAKYARLNAGMVRMNLGNMIRASIRRARKQAE